MLLISQTFGSSGNSSTPVGHSTPIRLMAIRLAILIRPRDHSFVVSRPWPTNRGTFPSLTYILNNANIPPATIGGFQTAENLPAVSRTMNFRCTVRDQRGGVNDSSVAITVAGGAGPFAVIAPNGGGTVSGAQNVTWSVNGTNGAPVNTANVKISLSTDGGNTFPTVLICQHA